MIASTTADAIRPGPRERNHLLYEPCAVCGKLVATRLYVNDQRRGPEGLLRCYDHLGHEVNPAAVPPRADIMDLPCPDCSHAWLHHDRPDGCRDCEREQEEDEEIDVCTERHPTMPKRWWTWTCPQCHRKARQWRPNTACAFCDSSHPETRGRVDLRQRGPTVIAYGLTRRAYGRWNQERGLPGWWP